MACKKGFALLYSGMAKTALAPFGGFKLGMRIPLYAVGLLQYQLGNSVAGSNLLFFVAQVYQYHLYFAAIIAINCARSIKAGNALL